MGRKRARTNIEKRTLVVWCCLAASMTFLSALLLALEPRPLASADGLTLAVVDSRSARGGGLEQVLRTATPLQAARWRAIVIHHSGHPRGNARTLARRHRRMGLKGLGYHFVIGNGRGAGDGEIQVGRRWRKQLPGAMCDGPYARWYDHHAISICLIGNGDRSAPTQAQMEQLLRLVTALQAKLRIPPQRVLLHANIARTTSPGRYFPAAAFRQQLLKLRRP